MNLIDFYKWGKLNPETIHVIIQSAKNISAMATEDAKAAVDHLRDSLEDKLDELEAWLVAQPMKSAEGISHTEMEAPKEEFLAAYTAAGFSYAHGDDGVGCELLTQLLT